MVGISLLVWAALLAPAAQSPPQGEPLSLDPGVRAHAGLDAIYRNFSQAYASLDASRVAGLYTEEALYISPGNDVRRGRAAVLKNFEPWFSSLKERRVRLRISFRVLERRVEGNWAYEVGIFNLVRQEPNRDPTTSRGKFVTVSTRGADGVWRFQVDTYNSW